jgi:4-hydroxy-tetrahydrodipicolinate synthase
LELAEHPQVIGVKYAVNDIDAFQRVVQDDEGRIDWYCGSAERFAPFFMLAGAKAYTSGAGNICPHLTLAMHEACAAGDWAQALRLQQIIRPIEDYRARGASSYNISFLKYAANKLGLDFGPPRPPQRRLSADEEHEIDALLEPILAAEAELAQTPAGVR